MITFVVYLAVILFLCERSHGNTIGHTSGHYDEYQYKPNGGRVEYSPDPYLNQNSRYVSPAIINGAYPSRYRETPYTDHRMTYDNPDQRVAYDKIDQHYRTYKSPPGYTSNYKSSPGYGNTYKSSPTYSGGHQSGQPDVRYTELNNKRDERRSKVYRPSFPVYYSKVAADDFTPSHTNIRYDNQQKYIDPNDEARSAYGSAEAATQTTGRAYSRQHDPCTRKYDGQYVLSKEFQKLFPHADNLCNFVKCANKKAFVNPCGPGTRNREDGDGFCSVLDLEGYCGQTVYDKAERRDLEQLIKTGHQQPYVYRREDFREYAHNGYR